MATTIDSLTIEISASAASAVRNIDTLTASLNRLRSACSNGVGNFRNVATGLRSVSTALNGVNINGRTTRALADLLSSLSALDGVRISPNIARTITDITDAVEAIPNNIVRRITEVAQAVERLSNATRGGRGTVRLNVQERGARQAANNIGFLGRLWTSLRRIAFYRVIRAAIKAVTETIKEGAENAYKWSDMFESHAGGVKTIAEAYDYLSSASYKMGNQLGAAWASLIRAIEPILLRIIDLITRAANAITQFFALLGGKTTYLKAIDYSKKWGDTTASGAKAAKEWKNQLMGFDEINRLEAPSSGGGGGGSSVPDIGSMFEEVEIDTKLADSFGKIKTIIEKNLGEIELLLDTALVGAGAVLAFSGINIPLGIGMMAIGFARIYGYAKENWSILNGKTELKLSELGVIVGGAMLGIGAVLAFSGANIPLGLALIAGGITTVAATATNWDGISSKVAEKLGYISAIAGVSFLALGTILAFSGVNVPLGIGLMAAGVGTLAMTGLNWDNLPGTIQKKFGKILAIIGAGSLALGAILAFSGVNIPLGIALMALGGVSLMKAEAMGVNWDSIPNLVVGAWDKMHKKLKKKWEELKEWFSGLVLNGFKIKTPHFSLWYDTSGTSWSAKIFDALGLPGVPHIGVDWYAKGGVINGAQLIGAGENGAEAIVPLERNTQWISRVAAEMNRQNRNYNDGDGEMIVAALYDVANMIVREMQNEKTGGGSFSKLAKEVTRWQNNAARANGF